MVVLKTYDLRIGDPIDHKYLRTVLSTALEATQRIGKVACESIVSTMQT